MMTFGARAVLLSVRCAIHRSGSFARTGLVRSSRACFVKRGRSLTQIPKVALLCWGAANASSRAATCQEATVRKAVDKKSLAKVQVHKVVFFLRLSLRALVLLLKFAPLLLLSPFTLVSARWASVWLDALLWVTETSGPTFIKLGQWASTRRDIFSREFCERFSALHVKVRPHSWAHTKQCLRRAFGDGWRRVLMFDSKEPVGSGCVAQVYRGWAKADQVEDVAFQSVVEEMEREDLLEAWEIPGLGGVARSLWQLWRGSKEEEDFGEKSHSEGICSAEKEHLIPVAIKVVHPGIRRQVEIDILLMKAGSWLLQCLPGLKWLSLCEIVDEFEKLMIKQIDLRFEAKNIERFQENFRNVDYVKFPTTLRPFVTRSILVETFEESVPVSNYLSSDIPPEVKQKIARVGMETMLKMVFIDNFVHGDLHPGNILVHCSSEGAGVPGDAHGKTTLTDLWDTVVVSFRPDRCPLQLVLLDAGIVTQLSNHDLANLKAVFTAVVLQQGERVAELLLNHARANECRDVPRFKKEMSQLVDDALNNTLSLGKVKLESNFASIVFAIMVLEGLGRSLDPNLDILDLVKPLLLKKSASLL
uniref:ABC1 atypical kinase-like domain-containing protein n=1 Tax=Gasterosteus aculeatus aculeatus TaxID=481459 RepID=G3NI61_GASAC